MSGRACDVWMQCPRPAVVLVAKGPSAREWVPACRECADWFRRQYEENGAADAWPGERPLPLVGA